MSDEITLSAFDASDYLDNEDVISAYLSECLATGDMDLVLKSLMDIAKARGVSRIAEASGLGRESLYKALSPGSHPRFETIQKVIAALGLKMAVVA